MKLDRLQKFALGQPQTTVVAQWGCLVYKVAGKIFLMLPLDGQVLEGITFKCTPAEFDELTQIDGIIQAPYCAKRMWVKLEDTSALPEPEILARIRHSYELVAAGLPKRKQVELGLLPAPTSRLAVKRARG